MASKFNVLSRKQWSIFILAIVALAGLVSISYTEYNIFDSQTFPTKSGIKKLLQDTYSDVVMVRQESNETAILSFYENVSSSGWKAVDLIMESTDFRIANVLHIEPSDVDKWPHEFVVMMSKEE